MPKKPKKQVKIAKRSASASSTSSRRSASSARTASTVRTVPFQVVPAKQSMMASLGAALPRGTFSTLGGTLGGFLGGPAGAAIGSTAGQFLSRATGFGSYEVKKNTLLEGVAQPTFQSGKGMRYTHREYVGQVLSSTGFVQTAYSLNPALSRTFPLLAGIAANFERWVPKGIIVEFITTSATGTSATSPAMGYVALATQYDCSDPLFASEQAFLNYDKSVTGVPYANLTHAVECDPEQRLVTQLLTRSGNLMSGQNVQFTDLGTLVVVTNGQPAAGNVIGQLWISIDVELCVPRPPVQGGMGYFHMACTGCSAANPFGTSQTIVSNIVNANLPATGVNSGTTFTIGPAGQYLLSIVWQGSSGTITSGASWTLGSGVQFTPNYINLMSQANINTSTQAATLAYVQIAQSYSATSASSNAIQCGGLAGMSGAVCDVFLTQLPYPVGGVL